MPSTPSCSTQVTTCQSGTGTGTGTDTECQSGIITGTDTYTAHASAQAQAHRHTVTPCTVQMYLHDPQVNREVVAAADHVVVVVAEFADGDLGDHQARGVGHVPVDANRGAMHG